APIRVHATDDRIIFACHADGRWYDEDGQEWQESGGAWTPVQSNRRFGLSGETPWACRWCAAGDPIVRVNLDQRFHERGRCLREPAAPPLAPGVELEPREAAAL